MNPTRTLTLLALGLAALPRGAAADDVSDLAGLLDEPVVSTASKAAETAGLAPATTSVITAEELRRFGVTSLDQAIEFLGLGLLTERSWGTPEIGARGVLLTGDFGNHVLLLIDGHAVNEPWDETAYFDQSAGIPLDLVDHVEVILGPGSVLYGSSAMLGVVNVITKRAKDYGGLHLLAETGSPKLAHLGAGYGQAFELSGKPAEVTAALDLHQTWGPNRTYPVQPYADGTWGGPSSNRQVGVPSGYLRFAAGDFELALRGAVSKRAATEIWGDFDNPDNWERDRWLSLDAKWGTSLSPHLRLGLRLYGDLYDYLQNTPQREDCLDGQVACTYLNSGESQWAGAEGNLSYDWAADGRFVTLLGLEGRYKHVNSSSSYVDAGTGDTTVVAPYSEAYGTLAAYLQQTGQLTGWLSLNLGLRLDHDAQLGSHLSPRAAAVASTWQGGTVKAIYAQAFRAPSAYERLFTDNVTQLPAPDLRPEVVQSLELALEQRVGAHHLRVGGFRSWWDDMVLMVPATQQQVDAGIASGVLPPGATDVLIYANASRVDSYGVDAAWDASAVGQRLRWGASLTLAHSRRDGDVRLEAAAQAFGNAHVSYDLGGGLPTLALAGRFVGTRPLSGYYGDPVPDAEASFHLLAAVSGPLGAGFSYRLAGTWSSTETTAYAVGPARDSPVDVLPRPRWEALLGIRWDSAP